MLDRLVENARIVAQGLHVQQLAGARRRKLEETLEGAQVVDGRRLPRTALSVSHQVTLQPVVKRKIT